MISGWSVYWLVCLPLVSARGALHFFLSSFVNFSLGIDQNLAMIKPININILFASANEEGAVKYRSLRNKVVFMYIHC